MNHNRKQMNKLKGGCLILGLLIIIGTGIQIFSESTPEKGLELKEGLIFIHGDSVKASVIPAYFKPTVYGMLLDCIEEKESGTGVLGDYGYDCNNVLFDSPYCAFGDLQFWQATFQEHCMDKYKFPNDIFGPEVSRMCADYILQDDFRNIWMWSTSKYCL